MTTKQKMRNLVTALLIVVCGAATAQQYSAEAMLPSVEKDGFYRITISPEISALLTFRFANVRVTDRNGEQVPYILEEAQEISSAEFVPYTILEKEQRSGCCTNLVLENDKGSTINNLHLRIRNAEVTKRASLLGSDDRKNWFALKEQFFLSNPDNRVATSELRIVDFPLSNYRYYWLKVEDSTSAPLNIESAGYYKVSQKDAGYSSVDVARLERSESKDRRTTYLKVNFDTAQWIDRISITSNGPPLFLRNGALYNISYLPNRKNQLTEYKDYVAPVRLSHEGADVIEFSYLRSKQLLLVIENGDNPPVHVASFDVLQRERALIAYLQKGKDYWLRIGGKEMEEPVYDLPLFRSRINGKLASVTPGPLVVYDRHKEPARGLFFTREYMWFAIIGIILVLGFFTWRMLRDNAVSDNTGS
jgi:hypothetical protein